jgi:hypothetical protein
VLEQSETSVQRISTSGGQVTVSTSIGNLDEDQDISYDWSASSAPLLQAAINADAKQSSLSFNPEGLPESARLVARVTVTNKGFQSSSKMTIVFQQGDVSAEEWSDSDNDGIADKFEGSLGTKDDAETENKLQGEAGQDVAFVMETDDGLKLRMGIDSRLAITQQGGLSYDEFISRRPEANINDEAFKSPEKVYDYEIAGLSRVGASAYIVIPHHEVFTAGTSYKKFHPATGWVEFVVDASNSVSSSPAVDGILGQCPKPQSDSFRPGINAGDACLQLWIQDGGPNDGDRLTENGLQSADQGFNGNIEKRGLVLFLRDGVDLENSDTMLAAADPVKFSIPRVGVAGSIAPSLVSLLAFCLFMRRRQHPLLN